MAKRLAKTRELEGVLHQIDPGRIQPWPDLNPRKVFDQEALDELAESIRQRGNVQPIVVSPAPEDAEAEYWLVAGERRWRAAEQANALLLCHVRPLTWEEAVEIAVIENLDRSDLGVLEEADGLQKLVKILGSQKAVAERLSRSQPWVSNRIRLLELPEEVLGLVREGIMEASTVRDVLLPFNKLKETARTLFFSRVAERYRELERTNNFTWPASLDAVQTVVGGIARDMSRSLDPRAWQEAPKFDPEIHEDCGCGGPEFRYDYSGKARRCFDLEWWNARQEEAIAAEEERVEKAAARAKKKAAKIGDAAVLSRDKVSQLYGYQTDTIGSRDGFAPGVLLDPTRLPAESLVFVQDDKRNGGRVELVCTDQGKARAARGMVTREKNKRVEVRRAQRLQEDLEVIADLQLEPWMLSHLILHSEGYGYNKLERVQEELGIELEYPKKESLPNLEEERLLTWVKLLAFRSRRGDYDDYRDAVEVEVEEELKAEYEPLLKEMIPETAEAAA